MKARTPNGSQAPKATRKAHLPRRRSCRAARSAPPQEMSCAGSKEWPVRRLGVLYARRKAAATPVCQTEGPAHTQATALSRAFQRRLEEIQLLPDGRTPAGLYRRRSEVAKPARLGQSGPLTGQQYSIRREYAAKAQERAPSAEKAQKGLQTQAISRSTSDPRQGITGVPLEQHHRHSGRVRNYEGSGKGKEGRRPQATIRSGSAAIAKTCATHRGVPPEEGWSGSSLSPFQMLMLRRHFSGRASVHASPVFYRCPRTFGLARTVTKPAARWRSWAAGETLRLAATHAGFAALTRLEVKRQSCDKGA